MNTILSNFFKKNYIFVIMYFIVCLLLIFVFPTSDEIKGIVIGSILTIIGSIIIVEFQKEKDTLENEIENRIIRQNLLSEIIDEIRWNIYIIEWRKNQAVNISASSSDEKIQHDFLMGSISKFEHIYYKHFNFSTNNMRMYRYFVAHIHFATDAGRIGMTKSSLFGTVDVLKKFLNVFDFFNSKERDYNYTEDMPDLKYEDFNLPISTK